MFNDEFDEPDTLHYAYEKPDENFPNFEVEEVIKDDGGRKI